MTDEQQLKLQAFLDGELPEKEARDVAAWVARDSEANALLTELRNTRKALVGFEPQVRVPESREFYWSKIQREIERRETTPRLAPKVSFFERFRRFIIPAGAFAALVIAGLIAFHPNAPRPVPANNGGERAEISDTETELADSSAVTYSDQNQGMTVVWLSYPAEKELADTSAGATIQ